LAKALAVKLSSKQGQEHFRSFYQSPSVTSKSGSGQAHQDKAWHTSEASWLLTLMEKWPKE
jgi:hypothetical protein